MSKQKQLPINTSAIKNSSKKVLRLVQTKSTNVYKSSPKVVLGVLATLLVVGGYAYFKSSEASNETYIVARGSIEEAVNVTGKIKASTDADLSFEKGGTVAAVYVTEGQKVYAGQTLVVLAGGTDYGQVLEASAAVASAQAQLDLLKNGTRREEIAVGEANVGSAKTALENTYGTVGDTVRNSYTTVSDAIRYRTQNFFSGTPSTGYTTAIPDTCNSELESRVENMRGSIEANLIAWSKIDTTNMSPKEKDAALLEAQGYLQSASTLIETMNAIVTAPCVASDTRFESYRSALSSARSSLSAAQAEITQKKNAITSAGNGITTAETTLALTSANTEPEKIRIQEAALRQAYARLYQARAQSSKNVITAPGNGVITKVDIAQGEYASPGKTVLRIVGTGEYTVEADVTESDIARIVLENTAKIIIPAIDSKETFTGKVVSIDPAEQSNEGNPLYRIVISLESQDKRIKSGMTAETTIVTSVVDNLVRIPTRFLTKVKGVSNVQVVIDQKSLESEEREIKTGRKSTDGFTEIVSGVEEGEILVLPTAPKK